MVPEAGPDEVGPTVERNYAIRPAALVIPNRIAVDIVLVRKLLRAADVGDVYDLVGGLRHFRPFGRGWLAGGSPQNRRFRKTCLGHGAVVRTGIGEALCACCCGD